MIKWKQKKNGWKSNQLKEEIMKFIIPSHKDKLLMPLLFNYNIYSRFVKHLLTILKIYLGGGF